MGVFKNQYIRTVTTFSWFKSGQEVKKPTRPIIIEDNVISTLVVLSIVVLLVHW